MCLIPTGHFKGEEYITGPGGVQVKRAARVSVNAAPEPVTKEKAITVTGSLIRADRVKQVTAASTSSSSSARQAVRRTPASNGEGEHHGCPQDHRYGVRGRHLALGIRRHVHHRHCRVRRRLRRRELTSARADGTGGPPARARGQRRARRPARPTPPGRVHSCPRTSIHHCGRKHLICLEALHAP